MNPKINFVMDAVCREPYRLFFPLGAWMGVVGVSPPKLLLVPREDEFAAMHKEAKDRSSQQIKKL